MENIEGTKFNSLTAIRPFDPPGTRHLRWVFRCDCGAETHSVLWAVVRGAVRQCAACGHKKQAVAISKHGLSRSREFNKFYQAKERCTNPRCARYHEYGGRGIKWLFDSYEQIYAELGPCPSGMTLDRINNDGNYESGNVRWATWKQQFASRRPWNWRQAQAAVLN